MYSGESLDLLNNYNPNDSDSDDSMEAHENDFHPIWSELPPPVLESIYSFMSRKDQCIMSMVCRNWNKEFNAPSLWRKITFELPYREYSGSVCPELRFAYKHCEMYHHVEIVCKRVRYYLLEFISTQLKSFLEVLGLHSQLQSLHFKGMDDYFNKIDDTSYSEVFQCILNLFLAQNQLKSIAFQNSQFNKAEAVELLKVICMKNRGDLKSLKFEEYAGETAQDEFSINIIDASLTFKTLVNLSEIVFDYSQVFENIIIANFEYATNNSFTKTWALKKMKVICKGSNMVTYQGISPDIWKYFAKKCPFLKMDLIYHAELYVRNRIEFFVKQNMPVNRFEFKWERHYGEALQTSIIFLLRHVTLCGINKFLEELSITWMQRLTNLDQDLIPFLKQCPRLRVLQLHLQHPIDELETLLNMWLLNSPVSLEVVYISIADVRTRANEAYYTDLADNYAPLLQVLGLSVIILVNPV